MRQDSGIGVLDKAVGVLHAVADSPCGLAELCERTGLTSHRTPAGRRPGSARLLPRDADGRWRLGPALTELAGTSTIRCWPRARGAAPAAGDHRRERAALPPGRQGTGMRRGSGTACGLRDTVPVGARLPMTAGSGAKVLLAYADPATNRPSCPRRFTDRTLAEVRRRGWAQSAAEREPGVASVSAPVRDITARCRRGLGVRPDRPHGPASRRRWAADLLAAADALTRRL